MLRDRLRLVKGVTNVPQQMVGRTFGEVMRGVNYSLYRDLGCWMTHGVYHYRYEGVDFYLVFDDGKVVAAEGNFAVAREQYLRGRGQA